MLRWGCRHVPAERCDGGYTEGRMEGSKTKFSPAAITTPVVAAIRSPTYLTS